MAVGLVLFFCRFVAGAGAAKDTTMLLHSAAAEKLPLLWRSWGATATAKLQLLLLLLLARCGAAGLMLGCCCGSAAVVDLLPLLICCC